MDNYEKEGRDDDCVWNYGVTELKGKVVMIKLFHAHKLTGRICEGGLVPHGLYSSLGLCAPAGTMHEGMRSGGWVFRHPPSGVQHSSVGRGEDEGGGWDGPSSAIRSPAFIRPPWPSRSARDAVARFLETRSDCEQGGGEIRVRCRFFPTLGLFSTSSSSPGSRLPSICIFPAQFGSGLVQFCVWS